jgi:serine/threonine protein kinase
MQQPPLPEPSAADGAKASTSDATVGLSATADTRGRQLQAPLASTIDFAPQELIGPYQILKRLGQGGMGAVYQARHVKLDKLVALKVLAPHLVDNSEALQRFEREMKAVGKLDHPNIVRAMDAGQAGQLHYLVMEYVEGTDLQRLVRANGPQPIGEACRLVRQAARALGYAHSRGLVHRDVKPSNLLLTAEGQIKVLDLGLARLGAASDSLTSSGASLGTPDYMAPEQWTDVRLVDHRSDLYALGCTLFYLLTGRPPFGDEQHSTVASKMAGHIYDAPPSLTDALPGVPEQLNALYLQLLAKQRDDRPVSALEVAEALAPFADSEPSADALPRRQLASSSPRSKSPAVVWTACGALVLIGLTAFGIYLANSARNRNMLPDQAEVHPEQVELSKGNEPSTKAPVAHQPPPPVDDDVTPPAPPLVSEDVPET